jgi:hypothetical protein
MLDVYVHCLFESDGASASVATSVVADLNVVIVVVPVVEVVVTTVLVVVVTLGCLATEDEDDREYITVPRSTRLDPTAISNPKPFSKYSTEINNELNLRRLRMKFSVSADDNDVSRWTPEIHINLCTFSCRNKAFDVNKGAHKKLTWKATNWLKKVIIRTYCVNVLTVKKIQSRGIVIELSA